LLLTASEEQGFENES